MSAGSTSVNLDWRLFHCTTASQGSLCQGDRLFVDVSLWLCMGSGALTTNAVLHLMFLHVLYSLLHPLSPIHCHQGGIGQVAAELLTHLNSSSGIAAARALYTSLLKGPAPGGEFFLALLQMETSQSAVERLPGAKIRHLYEVSLIALTGMWSNLVAFQPNTTVCTEGSGFLVSCAASISCHCADARAADTPMAHLDTPRHAQRPAIEYS